MGNALTLPIVCSRDLSVDLLRLKTEGNVQLAATVVENSDPTDDDESSRRGPDSEPQTLSSRVPDLTHTLPPIESLDRAARPARLALLFGNEAHGLSADWLAFCDRRLTIPMHGADSLNVAVAAGIFLHHFCSAESADQAGA